MNRLLRSIMKKKRFDESTIAIPLQLSESTLEHSDSVSGVASGAFDTSPVLATDRSSRKLGFSALN